jgi:hypothetical protein
MRLSNNGDSPVSLIIRRFKRASHRPALRVLSVALVVALALVFAPRQSAQVCLIDQNPSCFAAVKRDIAFIIDRSGSIALRGETYNLQLEGVIRSLRNPTVIPRDGSIAVSVVLFAEDAVVPVPLTEINSSAVAEEVAKAVEALKCTDIVNPVPPCPFGFTSYVAAIQTADNHLSQNGRQGAGRVLLMSTDGETSDGDAGFAAVLAQQRRNAATIEGIPFEIDAMLMGLFPETAELVTNKARVDQVVLPKPTTDLPGITFVINGGDCNIPMAALLSELTAAALDSADCNRQANEFAANVRTIIRGDISPVALTVNTVTDTAPGAPISPGIGTISLRQAIEAANCNGGLATITFAANINGQTISPLVPLPAITQPDIIIDGCDGQECAPSITIDGSQTNTELGEQHDDGILIRSNRVTVRGLRVINFDRAGIAVDPACPADTVGFNLIDRNVLEDNEVAGVLIAERGDGDAVRTNVGNTISRNTISGSATLIDLNGDGPTPNDTGDIDQGPNTLLNFPDSLSATLTADDTPVVALTGQTSAPAGSTVEIFGVTAFSVVSDNMSGNIVIEGVSFITQAEVAANGSFTATTATASPTGIYTATITDLDGNTSELMFQSAATNVARPLAAITTPINFGQVQVNMPSAAQQVQITNPGNAPLTIQSFTVAPCAPGDRDDSARFAVSTPGVTLPAIINPGQNVVFNVTLTPNACGAVMACLNVTTNNPLAQQVTSQLTGTGTGAPSALVTLEGNASSLQFGPVTPRGKAKKLRNRPLRTFTVQNVGCGTLNLSLASIRRIGDDVTSGRITNTDDSRFFNVTQVVGNTEAALPSSVVIVEGQSATFRVRFNPIIPAVAGDNTGLAASEVLPEEVTSQLVFNQNGGNPVTINLIGRVDEEFRLIDPDNPRRAPQVDLIRSGNQLTVEFSAWDADLDVNRATYQFLDRAGNPVGPSFDIDLRQAIEESDLVTGQSFTVSQSFSGSFNTLSVASVRITVFDGEAAQTATSGAITVQAAAVRAIRVTRSAMLFLPDVKLPPFK